MANSDYIIVGDTEKYDECLVCVCGKDKNNAEEALRRIIENPTENDKRLIKGYKNLRIKEVPANKCWWRNV